MKEFRFSKAWLPYSSQLFWQLCFVTLSLFILGCKRGTPQTVSSLNEESNQPFSVTSLGCLWQHVHFGGKTFNYKDYVNGILPHAQNTLTLCKNVKEDREPLLLERESVAEFIFVELTTELFDALDYLNLKDLTLNYQISLSNATQQLKIVSAQVAGAQLMKKTLFLPLNIKLGQMVLGEKLQLLMHISLRYQEIELKQFAVAPVVLY